MSLKTHRPKFDGLNYPGYMTVCMREVQLGLKCTFIWDFSCKSLCEKKKEHKSVLMLDFPCTCLCDSQLSNPATFNA